MGCARPAGPLPGLTLGRSSGRRGSDMSADETGRHAADAARGPDDAEAQPPAQMAGRPDTAVDGRGHDSSRPRNTLRRLLISLGVLGLVLALVVGGGLWLLTERWAGNIDRV